MWKTSLGWDDEILDATYQKWLHWLNLLKKVGDIRLPRCYHASVGKSKTEIVAPNAPDSKPSRAPSARASATRLTYTNLQLHIFSDSSTYAMAAVAYWRWQDNDGQIRLAFISSKCRVAPIKHTSVPRLELQAALLAARLADTITKEHRNMLPQGRYFWCDSSTVLYWIRNNARDYKAFVAHRLGEIDELTQIKEWHFIPTKMNIADIATRDSCELDVLQKEWLYGPEFLYGGQETWPTDIQQLEVGTEDLERVSLVVTEQYSPAVPEPERFSSWLRLLKSTCTVLLFIDKCKKRTSAIDGDMMRRAERLLIMHSQRQTFAEDLENLKQKKPLDRKSKLLTLTPVIDEYGVLRVGSRIEQAPGISPETKYPVILDGRSHVAQLIVRHHHVKAAHGNQEVVVNNVKQHYWIIRLRPTIKHVTSKCMFCRIKKTLPQPPRMGNLPEARMAHFQRPFTFCGVDLFGPMEVTVQYRRREKRYGVLFTCMTIRAIHIEVVSTLTTDAFIMALRRMAARRGWPQHMFSDNGTNLRGATNEIKKSISDLDEETLKGEAVKYGTTWTFSPPASPHWGGAWERLIRCVKNSLKVVLKERAPRDEVLNTLLAEVEHMVNSRPLTHVSVEPHSDESLTPNHFLLGASSNLPTIGAYDDSDAYLRKQWRISQRLADLFWKRWVREVLPDMRPRTKWHLEQRPLQVGDLVLIVDPDSPRNVWPRGRVQAVMAGRDGRIRVLDIKTKTGVLRRSAARIARIQTEDEC
uniref:SFRICE_041469 n=1 Tax=Spodoptera frugiperda TaxID=7108 RepID=A0A2H1VMV3_SPOFR